MLETDRQGLENGRQGLETGQQGLETGQQGLELNFQILGLNSDGNFGFFGFSNVQLDLDPKSKLKPDIFRIPTPGCRK